MHSSGYYNREKDLGHLFAAHSDCGGVIFSMVGVIINPVSGRGGRDPLNGDRRARVAGEQLARAGARGEIVVTRHGGHAVELARAFVAARVDTVIAWGGDGTMNEVAGPLVGTGIGLGIVPSGSGDGLARSMGIPSRDDDAWRLALQPGRRAIDVGFLGDRHFLNIAGIGFDAAVARAFNARTTRGGLGYLLSGMPVLRGYRCTRYTLTLDGTELNGPRFLVAFANGREYGNGAILAPGADPGDGWLDAVIADDGPIWRHIWRARRLTFRRTSPAQGITRLRVRSATVSADRFDCHVDGESFEARGTLQVRIQPGALVVSAIAPAG